MGIPVAEMFSPIPSYEGLYEISNYGIVKRLPTIFKYDTIYDCYRDRTWNFVKEMM